MAVSTIFQAAGGNGRMWLLFELRELGLDPGDYFHRYAARSVWATGAFGQNPSSPFA
jgi:hypothetical protein